VPAALACYVAYLSFHVDGARLASLSRYTMPLFAILMRLAAW
jgi:hypothetical protein